MVYSFLLSRLVHWLWSLFVVLKYEEWMAKLMHRLNKVKKFELCWFDRYLGIWWCLNSWWFFSVLLRLMNSFWLSESLFVSSILVTNTDFNYSANCFNLSWSVFAIAAPFLKSEWNPFIWVSHFFLQRSSAFQAI